MYLVLIAWLYVTLMMAVAEATSPTGTVLGALVTFILYGLLPMGIVGYILGTPARKRALQAREQAEQAAVRREETAPGTSADLTSKAPESGLHPTPSGSGSSIAPDTDSHATGAAEARSIPAVRKEL